MKKFCEFLIEHSMKIVLKLKKMKLLKKEQQESYENSKILYLLTKLKKQK